MIEKLSSLLSSELTVPNLFVNELGSQIENNKERENASKTSVAYLLIAQIIFYRILSEKRTDLPKIDLTSLKNPNDLADYYRSVQKIIYNPIFKLNIVNRLNNNAFKLLKDYIKVIFSLKPETFQYDVLALVFNSLVPPSIRKPMGVYYSKIETARLLSYLAIDSAGTKVLDPACGSGALLISCYQRKKELLLLKNGKFSIDDHRRFLSSEITGIDVMPFAVYLSTIHLAFQAPHWNTHQTRLVVFDSTLINPKFKIPLKFGITEDDRNIKSSKNLFIDCVDLVIMNPPFVRQESLKSLRLSYKDELQQAFNEYIPLIDKRMSYYCYFLFLADKFLNKGGKIAAVLPASFLRTKSSFRIRKWLLNEYNICNIIIREDKPYFSEDTSFREILLIAKKGERTGKIAYIILKTLTPKNMPTKDQLRSIPLDEHFSTKEWELRIVSREKLSPNNLFLPVATKDYFLFKSVSRIYKNGALISIDAYLNKTRGKIHRGIETSKGFRIQEMVIHNPKSCYLSLGDGWVVKDETETSIKTFHRHTKIEIRIPKECLIPHLRRMTGENRLDISDKKEFVITSSFSRFENFLSVRKKDTKNISSANLKNWRIYVEERMTNVMIARRFDISSSGTFLLSFYSKVKVAPPGVMWGISGLTSDDAKIFCLWFNSTLNLLQIFFNRVETRGAWMQLHEYVIKDLKMPNIHIWTRKERYPFYQLFDEIRDQKFPPLWQQLAMNILSSEIKPQDSDLLKNQYPSFEKIVGKQFKPRKKLDYLLLDILGIVSPNEYESFLQKIYLSLLLEFAVLKKMMK